MILTSKSKYAIIIVADIASQSPSLTSVKDISARHGIALRYVEQICAKLVKVGILSSFKGPGGGYCLAMLPQDITLMSVLHAVGESMRLVGCSGGSAGCMLADKKCAMHNVLDGLGITIRDYLTRYSIADVISGMLPQHSR